MSRFLPGIRIGVAVSLIALAQSCGSDSPGENYRTAIEVRHIDPEFLPGYESFNLTVFPDDQSVREIYDGFRTDLGRSKWGACSYRAHVWAYEAWRDHGINSGKVFLFYTTTHGKRNTATPYGRNWMYHVAPYVVTEEGKMWVLERFESTQRPMLMHEWLRFATSGARCKEITESDLELLKHACRNLKSRGTCKGNAAMIPVPPGGPPCYFRRTSMYYQNPQDVVRRDYLGAPELRRFRESEVLESCDRAMSGSAKERRRKCRAIVR